MEEGRFEQSQRAALSRLRQPVRVCWREPFFALLLMCLLFGSGWLWVLAGIGLYSSYASRALEAQVVAADVSAMIYWWLPTWILGGVLILVAVGVFVVACVLQKRVTYTPRDLFRVVHYRLWAVSARKTTGQDAASPYTVADAGASVPAQNLMDQDAGAEPSAADMPVND